MRSEVMVAILSDFCKKLDIKLKKVKRLAGIYEAAVVVTSREPHAYVGKALWVEDLNVSITDWEINELTANKYLHDYVSNFGLNTSEDYSQYSVLKYSIEIERNKSYFAWKKRCLCRYLA